MFKFDFDKREYDHFVEYCNFNDDELLVLSLRIKGKSISYIAQEINLSETTVNRLIKSIKKKLLKEMTQM